MKCFCLGPDFTGFPWPYYSNSARRREYKQILYEKLREWIEESGDKKKIFISNLLTEADWDIAGALMHISACDHTVSVVRECTPGARIIITPEDMASERQNALKELCKLGYDNDVRDILDKINRRKIDESGSVFAVMYCSGAVEDAVCYAYEKKKRVGILKLSKYGVYRG